MANGVRGLSYRRILTDVLATVFGVIATLAAVITGNDTVLVIAVYGLLLGTSTAVVTYCLTRFTGIAIEPSENEGRADSENTGSPYEHAKQVFTGKALESDSDIEEDTGWLIGRLENVLVLTLVFVGEFTALSIIFAAKSWVRREDTASENTTYYLAGTLVNFTYSIAVGLGAVWLLSSL